MRRILLSSTILGTALIAAPASAAELNCECAAALPLPPAAGSPPWVIAPWAGPYIGVSFALVDNNIRQSENGPGIWPTAYGAQYHDAYSATTGRIGLHAGYNIQRGMAVFGVEADIGKMLGSHSHVGLVTGNDRFRPAWDASLRSRLGVAVGQALFYGTGGISFANVKLVLDEVSAGSKTHTGWTLGAGTDMLLSKNLFGRIETRYTDYGSENYRTAYGPVRMDFDDKRVSVGLSYKF